YRQSQFDRVSQAQRQAGSAFKPVVYAAAFAEGVATPATLLADSPIVVQVSGRPWAPQNNDHDYRGWVTARTALEQSLNVPTVRLALAVGLEKIVSLAHDMGIAGHLEPMPALALGAFGVTPRELATVYGTLASGGTRPDVHGLSAIVSAAGERLEGPSLPEPQRVLQAQPAYLVTSLLEGVLDHGTAAGARRQGVTDELAGKTGTTNGRRDNWFAGYSPNRVTVVWVGYDDDGKSHLSGSSAALPIWSRFTRAVRPATGYPGFTPPPGIVTATVDPTTGQLATAACPTTVTDLFPEWKAPLEPCQAHSAGSSVPFQTASLGEGQSLAPLPAGPSGPAGEVQRPGTILIRRSAPPAEEAEEDWSVLSGTPSPPPPS
ncbi:MAG TPA: penicillin-binding transpeptidase domain-containing protein, partial [Thermoanaerobaculia bacterium]|nr:penicillin-binding transpeptidase domain-containing protein [Thermoanaerobaculia bacterium]